MENKKGVLITIIVLMVICVPLAIVGFIFHLNNKGNDLENANHDFLYEGYLWFYDLDGNLVNKYACKTSDCGMISTSIDDKEYGINYYTSGSEVALGYEGSSHVFIKDGNENYLYDIKNNRSIIPIESVKNYNTRIKDNMYIVKSNGNWGVVKVTNTGNNDLITVIQMQYQFIGLKDDVLNGVLNADNFIVKKDNKWFLIDKSNKELTTHFDSVIVDYNNKYVITKDNNNYAVYDYTGTKQFNNYNISNYATKGDYIAILSNNILSVFRDTTMLNSYSLESTNTKLTLDIVNNELVVKSDDKVFGSIAIN